MKTCCYDRLNPKDAFRLIVYEVFSMEKEVVICGTLVEISTIEFTYLLSTVH